MLRARRWQVGMWIIGTFSLLTLIGCGRGNDTPLAKTDGVLVFKGKPLSGYMVTFVSPKGVMATGMTDDDGHFDLETGGRHGAPVGICKVAISEISEIAAIDSKTALQAGSENIYKMQRERRKQRAQPANKKPSIPARYNTAESSQLQFTVSAKNENSFEIDLK